MKPGNPQAQLSTTPANQQTAMNPKTPTKPTPTPQKCGYQPSRSSSLFSHPRNGLACGWGVGGGVGGEGGGACAL